jgi:hypothetical protein
MCNGAPSLALSNQIPYADNPASVNWQTTLQQKSMRPKDAPPLGDEANLCHRSVSTAWIIIYASIAANLDTRPPNVWPHLTAAHDRELAPHLPPYGRWKLMTRILDRLQTMEQSSVL